MHALALLGHEAELRMLKVFLSRRENFQRSRSFPHFKTNRIIHKAPSLDYVLNTFSVQASFSRPSPTSQSSLHDPAPMTSSAERKTHSSSSSPVNTLDNSLARS